MPRTTRCTKNNKLLFQSWFGKLRCISSVFIPFTTDVAGVYCGPVIFVCARSTLLRKLFGGGGGGGSPPPPPSRLRGSCRHGRLHEEIPPSKIPCKLANGSHRTLITDFLQMMDLNKLRAEERSEEAIHLRSFLTNTHSALLVNL